MSNPRLTQAKKQSSFLKAAGERLGPIWRFFAKDKLSTFLLVASVVLLITFFSLLGSLGGEGEGTKVPLSTVTHVAESGRVAEATLLDYDHQVVVATEGGLTYYADYPGSDAATQQLVAELTEGGARVSVDPQSGKAERTVVVQFLLPILILVCLFAFFIRQTGDGTGGVGAFSVFGGKGKKRKKGEKGAITFDSVAGAGEALAELQRDPRLPRRPLQIPGDGRRRAQGRAPGRPAGDRQDAACQGHRRGGRRRLLQCLRG